VFLLLFVLLKMLYKSYVKDKKVGWIHGKRYRQTK